MQHLLFTWEDVTPSPEDENALPKNTSQLLGTIQSLLDPATWIETKDEQNDNQQELSNILPDSPGSCSPFRPLSPPPTPTDDVPLSVDVNENENDQLPPVMTIPLTKSKRVTFAPEVILVEEPQEVADDIVEVALVVPQEQPSDPSLVLAVKVSWTEMIVSHGALALVFLVAAIIYNWSSKD